MTVNDEKIPYDINREAAKNSALSSGTIGKYVFLKVKKSYPLIKKE